MDLRKLFTHWTYQIFSPGSLVRSKYDAFRHLLKYDNMSLEVIADLEEIYYGGEQVDLTRIDWLSSRLRVLVRKMIDQLMVMNPTRYLGLHDYFHKIEFYVRMGLDQPDLDLSPPYILPLDEIGGLADKVGGKASNLSSLVGTTGLEIPQGFVITAGAAHYLMDFNQLQPKINRRLRRVSLSTPEEMEGLCRQMQQLILDAEIPDNIAGCITRAVEVLAPETGTVAVRSSGVGEDGPGLSFAGQYESRLHVPVQDVLSAYKTVLASKYTPRAVSYRIRSGLSDQETPMAVLVMPMVEAAVSGVLYTRDKSHCRSNNDVAALFAVPGGGEALVSGRAIPQLTCIPRVPDPAPESLPESELLQKEEMVRLFQAGMQAEHHFQAPQDVEWSRNQAGTMFLLQSRPMRLEEYSWEVTDQVDSLPAKPLVACIVRASGGVGSGPVHFLDRMQDMASVPHGTVLVVDSLDPALSQLVDRVEAVIAESGSRASHFASVAREFGVPVVVTGVGIPREALTQGMEVTVDAMQGMVYPGRVDPLLAGFSSRKDKRTRLSRRLDPIMPRMIKLNLTDHTSEHFAPENCRSLHDLVRYVHEMGVSEMFSLVGKGSRAMARSKKLGTDLPILIYILDLGEGLFEPAKDKDIISPDDIRSSPMNAIWWGLSAQDIQWDQEQLHMDWEEFDRVSAGVFKTDSSLLASYAVLSHDYVHLMIRFGYHFCVLDTLSGSDEKNNYITFQFKGGGGSFEQRIFRLQFITGVLQHYGFEVQTKGDKLNARIRSLNEAATQKRLAVLGYLLARTKLMDVELSGLDEASREVDFFLQAVESR